METKSPRNNIAGAFGRFSSGEVELMETFNIDGVGQGSGSRFSSGEVELMETSTRNYKGSLQTKVASPLEKWN